MSLVTHKLQSSVSSSSGSGSLSGYDSEVGTTEIAIDTAFASGSSNASLAMSFAVSDLQSCFMLSDKGLTLATNGTATAEVQTLAITGSPTGGTVPLGFAGDVCDVAYNATASAVQAALDGMASVGSGNVTCSGGPWPGAAITATFSGALSKGRQPLIVASATSLTGGTSPAVAVTRTTAGLPSDTIVLKPGIPITWGASSGLPCPFSADVTQAYVTCTSASRLQAKLLTS